MAFDFSAVAVPFRMQPGLRQLTATATHLSPNRIGDRALVEKLDVLAHHAADALLSEPGFDSSPALATLRTQATTEWPDALRADGDGTWFAPLLGWGVDPDGTPVGGGPPQIGSCLANLPRRWRAAALLALAFAEDFAIVDARTTRIPWLTVCLPSHWSPVEVVGRTFADVHARVADSSALIAAGRPLLRVVTGHHCHERFVWSLTDDVALARHPSRPRPPRWSDAMDADEMAALSFLRSERQTFLPVEGHAQAVFTIRVAVEPLHTAIRSPVDARRVHDALLSMSAAVLRYRGLETVQGRLLEWLDHRARN